MALVGLAGCVVNQVSVGYSCDNPDQDYIGADGRPDPCPLREAADAGADADCPGGELVYITLGWDGPSRLWFGPEAEVPDCPYGPHSISYEGHTDLVAPPACDACTCEAPTGSCALPSTLTASTTPCGDFDAGAPTSFDAPAAWDGGCDNTIQTPDGAAHALTIGALTMKENGCALAPPLPAKVVSWHWNTFARVCDGKVWPAGPLVSTYCTPEGEPPLLGSHLCLSHDGEEACPEYGGSGFTEQHIFYDDVKDDRQCSACSCGPPTASLCTASISIYNGSNLTCSAPWLDQITISSEGPTCIDIQPPGQPLGSKSSGPTTYIPGTCQPMGGQASGDAIKLHPITFCCRP